MGPTIGMIIDADEKKNSSCETIATHKNRSRVSCFVTSVPLVRRMKRNVLTIFISVLILVLATWSFRDSIAKLLTVNLRIFIIFVGITIWNVCDSYRNSLFIDLTKHFDTICRVLDLSHSMKNTDSRLMIALIRLPEGEIQHIDSNLLRILGYNGCDRPHNIHQIVVANIPSINLRNCNEWDRKNCESLFNTDVTRCDGTIIRMGLAINRLSDSILEILFVESELQEIFCEPSRPADSGDPPFHSKQITLGEQVNYEEAYVMLLDIMGFTAACSRISSSEVLSWMGRVRKIIDGLLQEHALQLIETRGDSFLAVTAAPDGPLPASRALRCASAIARSVLAQEGTRVRIGLACGQATVARLRCAHSGDVLLLFGDVANVAGRLEQSGDAASVHVCGRTARSFAEEQGIACPPIEVRAPRGGRGAAFRRMRHAHTPPS